MLLIFGGFTDRVVLWRSESRLGLRAKIRYEGNSWRSRGLRVGSSNQPNKLETTRTKKSDALNVECRDLPILYCDQLRSGLADLLDLQSLCRFPNSCCWRVFRIVSASLTVAANDAVARATSNAITLGREGRLSSVVGLSTTGE